MKEEYDPLTDDVIKRLRMSADNKTKVCMQHDCIEAANVLQAQADEIVTLKSRMAQAKTLIGECRSALAEELSAWDIDPPLHHVKQAHDRCDMWLTQLPPPPTKEQA